MNPHWQISAGELFELTRPAAFALSALVSAWVLMSARRHRFSFYAAMAWALSTLFYPLIVLPIYLIIRAHRRRHQFHLQPASRPTDTDGPSDEEASSDEQTNSDEKTPQPIAYRPRLRRTLPLVYLLAVLSLGAIYYYAETRGPDAHLARASRARVLGQHDKAIKEYRSALALEDDPHIHNLLGIELAETGQLAEALTEFRRAESGGEPDELLSYRIASALNLLGRRTEAATEYQRFLSTPRCNQSYPDPQCASARTHVERITKSGS